MPARILSPRRYTSSPRVSRAVGCNCQIDPAAVLGVECVVGRPVPIPPPRLVAFPTVCVWHQTVIPMHPPVRAIAAAWFHHCLVRCRPSIVVAPHTILVGGVRSVPYTICSVL